jgi:hypothetical protein
MKLTKQQLRAWHYIIRNLKDKFSPGVPVKVTTKPLIGYRGSCAAKIKLGRLISLDIIIDSNMPFYSKKESLYHEWAHAMDWDANWTENSPKKDHGETWGVWYAKIYKYIVDDCWNDMARKGLLSKIHMQKWGIIEEKGV